MSEGKEYLPVPGDNRSEWFESLIRHRASKEQELSDGQMASSVVFSIVEHSHYVLTTFYLANCPAGRALCMKQEWKGGIPHQRPPDKFLALQNFGIERYGQNTRHEECNGLRQASGYPLLQRHPYSRSQEQPWLQHNRSV